MHPIIGLVGPSGSGKSTLIQEMTRIYPTLKIAKSLSTRPRRGEEDDLFYDFISLPQLRAMEAEGRLTHVSEYAGNYYTNDRLYLDSLVKDYYGIAALVESGVGYLRQAGYRVRVVKIKPLAYDLTSDAKRQKADELRALSDLKPDLEIINSFEPGGLDRSVKVLSDFINSWLV